MNVLDRVGLLLGIVAAVIVSDRGGGATTTTTSLTITEFGAVAGSTLDEDGGVNIGRR